MSKLVSHVPVFVIPRTVACQAALSMEFSRHLYQSRLPFPSSGDLPDPGMEPASPSLLADSLPSEPRWKPYNNNGTITKDIYYWVRCGGRTLAGPGDQSPVCIPSPLHPQKTYVYKTFAFPSPCESPSFLLKSQPNTLNVLFGLLLLRVFKVRALDTLMNYSVFLGLFHVYLLLNIFV